MTSFQDINLLTENRANSFAFTHEEAEKILFPTQDMELNFTQNEHRVRLERLYHKETRLKMHGSTLSEYWRNRRIPRGLRIPKPPTLCKHNPEFLRKWSEILNKCSLDLMLLIIEQVTADVKETHENIVSLEEQIKTTPHVDFDSLRVSIETSMKKYSDNLKEIKLRKYKRDTEDYLRNEVYPWDFSPSEPTITLQRSVTSAARGAARGVSRSRTQRRCGVRIDHGSDVATSSDFTMDSDSSAQDSSSVFLDKRTPGNRPNRRKNADEAVELQRHSRPWTRNFVKRR